MTYRGKAGRVEVRDPPLQVRFDANALIEQGFEPASDTLVLGNGLIAINFRIVGYSEVMANVTGGQRMRYVDKF